MYLFIHTYMSEITEARRVGAQVRMSYIYIYIYICVRKDVYKCLSETTDARQGGALFAFCLRS